jgi:hypothetical protein
MIQIHRAQLAVIAALFLATGTAHAIIDCAENDPNPICDNPQGWIDQCSKGDKKACKASHDLIAQEEEDEKRSFEDRWHEAKWDCALEWRSDDKDFPTIYREDIPKLLKAFKEMRGHCAWLQCLDDRSAGKVKHCYYTSERCGTPEWYTAKDKSGNKVMYFREKCER